MEPNSESTDTDESNSQVKPSIVKPEKSKKKTTPILLVILVLLLVGASSFGAYAWQHAKVEKLNTKISILNRDLSDYEQYSQSGTSYSLNDGITYGKQSSPSSLAIMDGQVAVLSAFYAQEIADTSNSGEIAYIELTVANNTKNTQTYNLNDFSLQLPDGTVLSNPAQYYANYTNATEVTLAAGGKSTQILTYTPNGNDANKGNGYLIFNPASPIYSCSVGSCTVTGSSTAGSGTTGSNADGSSTNTSNSSDTTRTSVYFKAPLN
jgi:hypothetical protein